MPPWSEILKNQKPSVALFSQVWWYKIWHDFNKIGRWRRYSQWGTIFPFVFDDEKLYYHSSCPTLEDAAIVEAFELKSPLPTYYPQHLHKHLPWQYSSQWMAQMPCYCNYWYHLSNTWCYLICQSTLRFVYFIVLCIPWNSWGHSEISSVCPK